VTDAPRGKTAQESHADTTLITRRLFRAPNPRRMVAPILLLSALAGLLVDFPNVRLEAPVIGAVAFALPAFLAIAITQPLAVAFGGRMYLRRSALMAFLGLVLVTTVLAVAVFVFLGLSVGRQPYVAPVAQISFLGYSSVVYLRHVVLEGTSSTRARALPAALAHPLLGFVGVAIALRPPFADWVLGSLFLLAFYGAAIAFTSVVRGPFLRNFGVDGISLLRYTIDHFTEQGDEARREMEGFFARMAVPARVRVGAIAFRADGGLRGALLAPMVHPGPMGLIGGSDLPAKLTAALGDVTRNLLVAHGPTTHDQNPASSSECDRLAAGVRDLLGRLPFSDGAGPLVRATEGPATASAQAFGDAVLVTATMAPNPTDDIDTATGFAAVQEARLAGARDAIFVDAHNCMEASSGLTLFGSPGSHAILGATRAAVEGAMRAPRGRLQVGFGSRTEFATPEQGIGSCGIQALVVAASGRRTAYVLVDGNNMVPGLRDEIRTRLFGVVEDAEVLTTDNHSVNLTMGGFNPVGLNFDRARLVDLAEEAVREAASGFVDAEVGAGSGWVDLRIFGPESTARLTTSVGATASVVRPAFFLTFALAFLFSVVVLLLA